MPSLGVPLAHIQPWESSKNELINKDYYRDGKDIEQEYRASSKNTQTDNPVADLGVKVAVCMPTSCSEKDIPKVLGSFDFGGLAALHFVDADCVPTKVVPTTAFWIFMSFMAFFVVWAIAATAFDYVLHAYFNGKVIKNKERVVRKELSLNGNDHVLAVGLLTHSIRPALSIAAAGIGAVQEIVDAFLAFSFYTNAATILDMSPPKEGNIKSLASIRFISMTWVASGHTLLENTFGGRLTPPMMLFIGFYVVILPFTDGPYSAALTDYLGTIEDNVRRCQDNWWRNMLYINNFYLEEGAARVRSDKMKTEKKIDVFFSEYYEKPWARCTPYFIGIIVGYILVKFRDRRPKLNKIIIVVIWIAATAVGFACVYSPYRYIKGDHNWSKFTRATYNNFSRIGWSIAVSWVIVANHLGWGGPIATFMEHPLWQPLGRLSYCAYIVHSFVIHYVFNLDDRPAHYVSIWQTYVYRVIPVVVLSYFFAFVWSCLFEVSSIKLEKLLIGGIVPNRKPRSIKPEPNGEAVPAKEENGDLKL
ncbi:hypothetical protein ANCCEY_04048 [Ancylostoma ceylanicum]|uniref:Acyltransferase 3 domain-containing protein n=1 Tax=Ancylostoma ceylanicum TaxID=53326 RepID=A0A0D6M3E1_9BILA|nr:hypothetical protein ANCCEY_04048 [Ancylostoma ceylanicum]